MSDEELEQVLDPDVARVRHTRRLDEVGAALALIYRRFGFDRGPAVELLESPQGIAHPPMTYELRLASAIVRSAVQLAERRGGEPPVHDLEGFGSTTATGFEASGTFLPGWRRIGEVETSVEQLVAAELGLWRTDLLMTERLAPATPQYDPEANTPEAQAMRALGVLRHEALIAALAPARARLVARPRVWRTSGGDIHREGGPAILWPGGFGLYVLNGVRVPDWLAMMPAEALESSQLERLANAEQRREFVRKIGVERLCRDLGAKVVDKRTYRVAHRAHRPTGECSARDAACEQESHWVTETVAVEYELVDLDLDDGRRRPYLKMKNPSVPGLYHLEGVPPEVRTVQEAINWRAHGDTRKHWTPEVLT